MEENNINSNSIENRNQAICYAGSRVVFQTTPSLLLRLPPSSPCARAYTSKDTNESAYNLQSVLFYVIKITSDDSFNSLFVLLLTWSARMFPHGSRPCCAQTPHAVQIGFEATIFRCLKFFSSFLFSVGMFIFTFATLWFMAFFLWLFGVCARFSYKTFFFFLSHFICL